MSRHLAFRALAVCLAAFGVLFCLALFTPKPAHAQGKKSIAVGVIEGPQGAPTRKRVLKKLKDTKKYEVTDAEDLRPGADKSAYSAMAQALQVEAIVVGKVSKSLDLTLSVIGPDGNLIKDVKLKGGSGPKLEKAIDKELEPALAATLGGKKAAVEEEVELEDEEEEGGAPAGGAAKGDEDEEDEEEDAKADEDEEETPPAAEESKPGRRPIEVTLAGKFYSRTFDYSEGYKGPIFPYKLALAPAIVATARVYPFAFSRDDALGNLGIMAKFEFGIATKTNYQQSNGPGQPVVTYPLNTGMSEWQVGLRGRLPVGQHELGVFGLYGAHAFVLVGDEGPPPERPNPLVPDVNYQFLRIGVDARLRFGKITAGSHFAPRFLTSMANIDQTYWWFPGATGSGIDFGAFVAYELLKFMDVAVGGDYLRYGFDFNAIPSNAGLPGSTARSVAGGATDIYLGGWLGVIFHFDGKASEADGTVAVEAAPKPDPDAEEEEEE